MDKLATKFAEYMYPFLPAGGTVAERKQLVSVVDFHLRFVGDQFKEELGSLLFIECATEAKQDPLSLEQLTRIVSRVQKRLVRESSRTRSLPLEVADRPSPSAAALPADLEATVGRFTAYLKAKLSLRDAMIFHARFIEGESVAEICRGMQVKKSLVYERVNVIKAAFRTFLESLERPGFNE